MPLCKPYPPSRRKITHPRISSQPGLLEIAFDESTDLKADRVAMRIEKTGDVFLK